MTRVRICTTVVAAAFLLAMFVIASMVGYNTMNMMDALYSSGTDAQANELSGNATCNDRSSGAHVSVTSRCDHRDRDGDLSVETGKAHADFNALMERRYPSPT